MPSNIDLVIRSIGIFYSIGMVIGFTRIGIRTYILGRPGVEEIIMGVSMLFWTGDSTLRVITLQKGTNQMSPEKRAALTPEEIWRHENGSKALITAGFCYIAYIWGAKTCLLLFYRRILERMERFRIIQITAWALGISFIASCLGTFLVCRPFRKNWQVVPDPGRM